MKKYTDLPLEVNKTYKTKMQSGELFTITKIINNSYVEGIYANSPDLGKCPLLADRLINDKILVDTIEYCKTCGKEI